LAFALRQQWSLSVNFLNLDDLYRRIPKRSARGDIRRLSACFLLLRISKGHSRFFPEAYVDAYAEYVRQNSLKAKEGSARAFAGTKAAQSLIEKIQAEFQAILDDQKVFTKKELANLFGVATRTVQSWINKKLLMCTPKETITKSQIEKCFTWMIPTSD
jgi:hypothetical protein